MTTPRPRPDPRPRAATPTQAATLQTPAALERRRRVAAAVLAGTTERAVYEDETGRKWAVLVPLGRAVDAAQGVVIGPPDLRDSGLAHLPESLLLALHNELFNRGLLTERDLVGRGQELQAAFMAVLRADVGALRDAYRSDMGA